ncbi:MAG: tRNA (adenosine(37)-N6)-threonylcarbamoyltransferase complex transferase subunit TsaD, partial [Candidatus Magasanikbacteria bacterium]|nr:tRNA (adenosine(37)-N6)-threonylcarbamoyltransferase complex transferase subunit TsaD [Candidatus Magasanikbacteria bacterium]
PYPGGTEISELAEQGTRSAINFPRPMMRDDNYDFSFAGLKTSGRTWIEARDKKISLKEKRDVCASYQAAVVDVLISKLTRAAKQYKPKTILLGGGVAANDELRRALEKAVAEMPGITLVIPQKKYTTDNAAMIGAAAYYTGTKFKSSWRSLVANPSFEIQ